MVTKKRVELAESMVRSRRFAGLNLSSYRSVLDKEVEKQFADQPYSCGIADCRNREEHTLEGLQTGADDYISKPFN